MIGEYKFNKLLRDIIVSDFNDNQYEFVRFFKLPNKKFTEFIITKSHFLTNVLELLLINAGIR